MTATLDQIEAAAQTGDLLFFSGRRLFSWAIRLRSCSKWSHVGFAVRQMDGCLCVVESIEGYGVRKVPFAVWSLWDGDVGLYRINKFHKDRRTDHTACAFALTQLSKSYASPWQFVRSFSLLWSRLSRVLGRPEDTDPQRYFCSELVAWAFMQAGISFPVSPARIKPGDLANDCRFTLIMETDS